MGTIGKAISLRVWSLTAQAFKVVRQIETPYLPDPIMRRLGGSSFRRRPRREACDPRKRAARGVKGVRKEKLDFNDPNQRRLPWP